MNVNSSIAPERLAGLKTTELDASARAFLADTEQQPPVRIMASEALSLWKARLTIAASSVRPLHGAEHLIAKLGGLRPDTDLEQIGFSGPKSAGNLFFNGENGEFVGFIAVSIAVT